MTWEEYLAKTGGKVTRKNIEDRRAQEPTVRPSHPDSIVRGLPQTPHEWELYKQKLAAFEAYKAGNIPTPKPPSPYGLEQVEGTPGPGDPAGLESRRAALLERLRIDQEAMKELERRLDATKKARKR